MRTRGIDAVVLWPPGPQRREANQASARAFGLSGEASALLMPDCLLLAAGDLRDGAAGLLSGAWAGIEGTFSCAGAETRRGGIYLPVDGPLEILGERSRELFETIRFFAFEAAIGFYLGRTGQSPILKGFGTGEIIPGIVERQFQWRSCRLAILRFEGDLENLNYLSWKEVAASWRPRQHKTGRNRWPEASVEVT